MIICLQLLSRLTIKCHCRKNYNIFSISNFLCFTVCDVGYEGDGSGGCKPCDIGYYRNDVNTTFCVPCNSTRNGTTTIMTGANSTDLCGEFLKKKFRR